MTHISHDKTDWQSLADQQNWFERFKTQDADGLRFQQFCQFLEATLYQYFQLFPQAPPSSEQSEQAARFSHQQEMQLFKMFDLRNNHLISRDEFGRMCSQWLANIYRPLSALVVVDVQNDFIDGSLALINGPAGQDGAEVVPVINNLIETCQFDSIVYTQDWHPANHIGFHSNLHMRKHVIKQQVAPPTNGKMTDEKDSSVCGHDKENGQSTGETGVEEEQDFGNRDEQQSNNDTSCKFKLKKLNGKANVFDVVLFEDGQVEQKLWPTHCVQNSWGAQLHPKLKVVPDAIRIYKGTLENIDAYSAFWDNMRRNETGLRQELQTKKISDLYFCGLALDYCVAASAIDSARAGFITFVIEDACRGIDLSEMENRRREMIENGVLIVNSSGVKDYLNIKSGDHVASGKHNYDYCQSSGNQGGGSNPTALKRSLNQELLRDICFKRATLL